MGLRVGPAFRRAMRAVVRRKGFGKALIELVVAIAVPSELRDRYSAMWLAEYDAAYAESASAAHRFALSLAFGVAELRFGLHADPGLRPQGAPRNINWGGAIWPIATALVCVALFVVFPRLAPAPVVPAPVVSAPVVPLAIVPSATVEAPAALTVDVSKMAFAVGGRLGRCSSVATAGRSIAVSPDLLHDFPCNSEVELYLGSAFAGTGLPRTIKATVVDTMAPGQSNTVNLFVSSREEALNLGVWKASKGVPPIRLRKPSRPTAEAGNASAGFAARKQRQGKTSDG